MDAGIGPGGHRERGPDVGGGQGVLQGRLDRRQPGLALESAEAAAFVGDLDGVEAPRHAC